MQFWHVYQCYGEIQSADLEQTQTLKNWWHLFWLSIKCRYNSTRIVGLSYLPVQRILLFFQDALRSISRPKEAIVDLPSSYTELIARGYFTHPWKLSAKCGEQERWINFIIEKSIPWWNKLLAEFHLSSNSVQFRFWVINKR